VVIDESDTLFDNESVMKRCYAKITSLLVTMYNCELTNR